MRAERSGETAAVRPERALRLGSILLGAYLRVALRTTRWRLEAADGAWSALRETPTIVLFWHEGLAMTPALLGLLRRSGRDPASRRPVHALISRHRDGAFAASIAARFGIRIVSGSAAREKGGRRTDRGGAAALRRMLALLGEGAHVAIAADGPRGPAHRPQPGIALLADLALAPIVPCAFATRPQIRLGGWDRMRLPVPLGRGRIVLGPPLRAGGGAPSREDRAALLARVAAGLEAARAQAEAR